MLFAFEVCFGFFGIVATALGLWAHDMQCLVFGMGSFAVVAMTLLHGTVGDYLYNKKVGAGKAKYRLPFWLRWNDCHVGHLKEDLDNYEGRDFANYLYYDNRAQKLVRYHSVAPPLAPRKSRA